MGRYLRGKKKGQEPTVGGVWAVAAWGARIQERGIWLRVKYSEQYKRG